MREIHTREEFSALAAELGVRPDWHEPDEQGITARLDGTPLDFDNAMGCRWSEPWGNWPAHAELHVIFSEKVVENGIARRGRDIACVNLANLCAWGSQPGTEEPALRHQVRSLEAELEDLKSTLRRLGGAA